MKKLLLAGLLALAGCSKPISAMDACRKLEAAGVAKNCHEAKPGGLAAAAVEDAEFDLVSVPGKGGAVFRFDRDDAFDSTVTAFTGAAMLAGPHRYGNKAARIFVQMNEGASLEAGKKAKAVVDGL